MYASHYEIMFAKHLHIFNVCQRNIFIFTSHSLCKGAMTYINVYFTVCLLRFNSLVAIYQYTLLYTKQHSQLKELHNV